MVMGHKTDGLILQMTDFVGPLVPRCCMTLRYWNSNGRRPSRCDPKTGTAATRASDTDWEILYMRFTFLYLIEFAASSASSFLVGLPLLSEACYFFFHHLFSHLWFSSFGSCCSQGWVGGWVRGWVRGCNNVLLSGYATSLPRHYGRKGKPHLVLPRSMLG